MSLENPLTNVVQLQPNSKYPVDHDAGCFLIVLMSTNATTILKARIMLVNFWILTEYSTRSTATARPSVPTEANITEMRISCAFVRDCFYFGGLDHFQVIY